MTLEAMSAIVDIVVPGLAVFVARTVKAPANRRFQFGYATYEPLMTTVEGILGPGQARPRSSTPSATPCIRGARGRRPGAPGPDRGAEPPRCRHRRGGGLAPGTVRGRHAGHGGVRGARRRRHLRSRGTTSAYIPG